MTAVPRVVLAGGRAGPELAAQIGSPVRAMAVFGGSTLLELVVAALTGADETAPVTVVGDVPVAPGYNRVDDQGDFVSNLLAGVGQYPAADWVLVTSADMPFLTPAGVSAFVREALEQGARRAVAIVYPVVPVSLCYAKYPGLKRTAVRLREGELTGGNMMLARPSFFLDRRELLGRAFAARKNPFRLASMLGLGTLVRLICAQTVAPAWLDIATLERRAGMLVGGSVCAMVCDSPEIATDLDRPSDFATAASYTRCAPADSN